jgi:hypothetical protein
MDPTGLPESALHRIRVLLQMLAVVFQSSTSKSLPLPHCASFLQTLLKGCLDLAHAWPAWEAIAGSLLTTLACLELSKDRFALIQKTWSDEGIWKSMKSPMLLVSAGERLPLSFLAPGVFMLHTSQPRMQAMSSLPRVGTQCEIRTPTYAHGTCLAGSSSASSPGRLRRTSRRSASCARHCSARRCVRWQRRWTRWATPVR